MTRPTTHLLAALALILAPSLALACNTSNPVIHQCDRQGGPDWYENFCEFDTNGDDFLTESELCQDRQACGSFARANRKSGEERVERVSGEWKIRQVRRSVLSTDEFVDYWSARCGNAPASADEAT